MKFKTFCACLALVMYAGTAVAMDSGSSHNNDGKNADIGKVVAKEMTWEEYMRERPEGVVDIVDEDLKFGSFDGLDLVNKNFSFPYLKKLHIELYILGEFKKLSSNLKSSLSFLLAKSPNLELLKMTQFGSIGFPREIVNLKGLTQLDYCDDKLTEIPEKIGDLTNLRKLSLVSNELTELPKEIGNLTNLRELSLSSNKLTELPKEIGNLKNLESLKFIGVGLTKLPEEIGNLTNLKRLDLFHTKLARLPREIGNLINLKILDIGGLINLEREGIKIIENKNNLVIDLSNQNLLQVPFDIVNCRNSEKLDLSNNNLEDLPALMVQLKKLKKIDLRGNPKINSIDKIHDVIFGLPELDSIRLTEDGKDREYNRKEISEIRKERIKELAKKIRDVDEEVSGITVEYLTEYKNERGLSAQEMRNQMKDNKTLEENLSAKKRLLKGLLSRLKEAVSKEIIRN